MDFREFKENYQKKAVEEISFSSPKEPLVSVLVQTYQQKHFIEECLESILMQETTFAYEIIVGDDGSTDGTREICLEYAERYPDRLRLFLHHRENQITVLGQPTSNFNAFYNFFSARGKYIAFCEGDDKWTDPLKLEKQVGFLKENPSFSFTYHKFLTINETGEKFPTLLEQEQSTRNLLGEELLKTKFHPLLLTICFKKRNLNVPKQLLEVLNVDTFLLSLFGEVGDANFQENIHPSLYRFRTAGVWSNTIRGKKLISKIQTYRNLSGYFQEKKDETYANFFIKQMKQHYKMLVVYHLRNKNLVMAGKTGWDYIKS